MTFPNQPNDDHDDADAGDDPRDGSNRFHQANGIVGRRRNRPHEEEKPERHNEKDDTNNYDSHIPTSHRRVIEAMADDQLCSRSFSCIRLPAAQRSDYARK